MLDDPALAETLVRAGRKQAAGYSWRRAAEGLTDLYTAPPPPGDVMGTMRVALHAGQLDQPIPGGIGRYLEGLLRHLPAAGVVVERFSAGRWRYEAWHRFQRPVHVAPGGGARPAR